MTADLDDQTARTATGRPAGARPARTGRRLEAGFAPAFVGELELSGHVADLSPAKRPDGGQYARARLLVRLHGDPLGFLDLPLPAGTIPGHALRAAAEDALAEPLAAHLAVDRLAAATDIPTPFGPACAASGPHGLIWPSVTVVVCTRDRAASLAACLGRLLANDYPDFDVVVVDNAPRTDATRRIVDTVADPRVRYVLEPRPGLSTARNAGVRVARGTIIAFTDDDVLVDRGWVRALVRGFTRAPRVGTVTGLVPPAELDTAAQGFFEGRVHWSASTRRRLYDLDRHATDDPLYPYACGVVGTGANFAITREAAAVVGAFDEALGAGSLAKGGEDLDWFTRVLLADSTIAYEPAAVAWHLHRKEEHALRAQLFGYGSGLAAFAVKQLLEPGRGGDVARKIPRALARAAAPPAPTGDVVRLPLRLRLAELRGLAYGPYAYLAGRRRGPARPEAGTGSRR